MNFNTHNEKPTAATIRDGLNFVFWTTLPPQKERVNVYYHDDAACVQR